MEITSEIEANLFLNKISYKSSLGASLMNKKVNEIVEIKNSKLKTIEIK